MGSNIIVYPADKSVVYDDFFYDSKHFLKVCNLGTPEYNKEIRQIMSKVPFQDLLDEHVKNGVNDDRNKRGNYQNNAGFAGSQCNQRRDRENIEKNFGAAIPALRVGTDKYLDLMRLLSKLAAVMGMAVATPEFLAQNPLVAEEIGFVEREVGEGINMALLSICFQKLDKVQRTGRHVDGENGDTCKEVMVASKILMDCNREYVHVNVILFV